MVLAYIRQGLSVRGGRRGWRAARPSARLAGARRRPGAATATRLPAPAASDRPGQALERAGRLQERPKVCSATPGKDTSESSGWTTPVRHVAHKSHTIRPRKPECFVPGCSKP